MLVSSHAVSSRLTCVNAKLCTLIYGISNNIPLFVCLEFPGV